MNREPPSKERIRVLERELGVANVELTTAAGLLEKAGLPDTAKVVLNGVAYHEEVLHGKRSTRSRPALENLVKRLTVIMDGFDRAAVEAVGPNAHLRPMAVDNVETIREAIMVLTWQA